MIDPRTPKRPLLWTDLVLDLQDLLVNIQQDIYIVGGAVRDAYRHYPIHDIDLITPKDAIITGRKIANLLNGDFFILDQTRDVARILIAEYNIDIACYRGVDLLADLTDRDFTLNAMAVQLNGDLNLLIDPLNGEQDLIDRRIRRCSETSLYSDPIRSMRAIRQSVQLNARIDPDTLADIRATTPNLMTTSIERIRDELFKMLGLDAPQTALRVAFALDIIQQAIPETATFDQSTALTAVEKLQAILLTISPKRTESSAAQFYLGMLVMGLDRFRSQLQTHITQTWPNERSHWQLLLLAALLHTLEPDIAEKRIHNLHLSNDEKKRFKLAIQHQNLPLTMDLDDLSIHRFWYQLGESGIDVCLMALGTYLSRIGHQSDQDGWVANVERIRLILNAYYFLYDELVSPPLLVDGDYLMRTLSLTQGKQIGELLTCIREGQVTGEIKTIDDALEAARNYLS